MGVTIKYKDHKQAWYGEVNHEGQRALVSFGKDKAAATAWRTETLLTIKLGQFKIEPKAARVTLRQFGEKVLALSGGRKDGTMEQYRRNARIHIYPSSLGSMQITAIKKHHVEEFVNSLPTLGNGSRAYVLAVVSVILAAAVEQELIDKNPAADMKKKIPKSDEERLKDAAEVRVLTDDQSKALLTGVRTLRGLLKWALFFTMLRTGMRISEASALMWDCVDFAKRRIHVKRNVSNDKLSTPKSKASIRYIDMTPHLQQVLQQLHAKAGDNPTGYVFANRLGGFFRYDTVIERDWNPVADELGIGRITPHILRHTFASVLLAHGKSIVYVSKLLGHSSIEVTLKIYSHLIPGDKANNIDVLDGKAEPLALVVNNDGPRPHRDLSDPDDTD